METALSLSGGMVLIDVIGQEELLMSTKFACTDCGIGFGEISPRMFSFNNPLGACETCKGLGVKMEIDVDLVIPDYSKSIGERAITPSELRKTDIIIKCLQLWQNTIILT